MSSYLILALYLVVNVAPAVVMLLKSRGLLFLCAVLALLVPIVGVAVSIVVSLFGTFRLARPGSPWAVVSYDGATLQRARDRYGSFATRPAAWMVAALAAGVVLTLAGIVRIL